MKTTITIRTFTSRKDNNEYVIKAEILTPDIESIETTSVSAQILSVWVEPAESLYKKRINDNSDDLNDNEYLGLIE